ncbi:MAG TPA: TGS domain-containing protein, partial [Firmicutes bacterium]|nr:TGS domain-containing protein [Bacillota bacterium]
MENVKVTLPDGAVIELPSGTTVGELASRIGRRLAAKAVVGLVDGVAVDLSFPISEDCHVTILDATSPEGLNTMRHSAAHVMAQAVKRLFPGVKLAIGPTIDDGFYYDFDIDHAFTSEDLEKIEAEMAKIIAEDLPIV